MPGKIRVYKGGEAGDWRDKDETPTRAPGGTNTETGKLETVDEAVDRMAGTASNAGKQSQSSDASNGY